MTFDPGDDQKSKYQVVRGRFFDTFISLFTQREANFETEISEKNKKLVISLNTTSNKKQWLVLCPVTVFDNISEKPHKLFDLQCIWFKS